MNTLKWLLGLVFVAAAGAQSLTPNTTLCAAITSTSQQNICLTATSGTSPNWSIVNQVGIYVDNEYMLVNVSNNQVITGTNQYVPVSRGNRGGKGAPTTHANGAVAWIAALPTGIPSQGLPGANGFSYNTSLRFVGTCTRTSEPFLPIILVDLGEKRDCIANSSVPALGSWTDYNELGDPIYGGIQALSVNGALSVTAGNYVITKAGVFAGTLAAPTAGVQDGTVIRISSTTANAHTITATGLLQTGTASVNVATFAAQAGAGLTLQAYNGKWIVLASVGITFS